MALELVSKSPTRQDTTSSTTSTASTGSSRSTHIVYNPRTFKLDALDQEDFEHCKGLIRTNSPGRSLDADLYMDVGSEKNPVKARYATVDVGKLGWRISLQRLLVVALVFIGLVSFWAALYWHGAWVDQQLHTMYRSSLSLEQHGCVAFVMDF